VLSSDDVTAALVGARRPQQFGDVHVGIEFWLDPDGRAALASVFSSPS
jgi:hypothetical protein